MFAYENDVSGISGGQALDIGNCDPSITCNQLNAQTGVRTHDWYRNYRSNINYGSLIGRRTAPATTATGTIPIGALNDFNLNMRAVQTMQGGFGAWMVMTFKYPISPDIATCQAMRINGTTYTANAAADAVTTVAPNSTISTYVYMRNDGSTRWSRTAGQPHRLGPITPRDTDIWKPINGGNDNRAEMQQATVDPGQTATVIFNATAPTEPGIYYYDWSMLQEGVRWLDNAPSTPCYTKIEVPGAPNGVRHKIYNANEVEFTDFLVRDDQNITAEMSSYIWPDTGTRADGNTRLWLSGRWGRAWNDRGNNDASNQADINIMSSFNRAAELTCPDTGMVDLSVAPDDPGAGDWDGNSGGGGSGDGDDIDPKTGGGGGGKDGGGGGGDTGGGDKDGGGGGGDTGGGGGGDGKAATTVWAQAGAGSGSCRQRVPLAYVPEDDGTNMFAPDDGRDGSTTPNGNRWLSIRRESFDSGYTPRLGGFASNQKRLLDGKTGNFLVEVEISNIHVDARDLDFSTDDINVQGGILDNKLQVTERTDFPQATNDNLQSGSQGPIQGGEAFTDWDNIRSPSSGAFNDTITANNLDFSGPPGSNFGADPSNMTNVFQARTREWGTLRTVSLLQDGNDLDNSPQYPRKVEPLSYTSGITRINDTRLEWDEYVHWTQVDDKGHNYPQQEERVTAVYTGPASSETVSVVNTVDTGSSQYINQTCSVFIGYYGTTPLYEDQDCSYWTSCSSQSYATGAHPNGNHRRYYSDVVRTDGYGWINTDATHNGTYLGTGTYFFGEFVNTNPAWARTDITRPGDPFWQDTNVTSMNNGGSTSKPAHVNRWIRDTNDPLYANRHFFTTPHDVHIPNGVDYSYTSYCVYPNGGGTTSKNVTVFPVYNSQGDLYEDSTGSYTGVSGQYDFTYDGFKDGRVDVSWNWVTNWQRVRYENTFFNRHRKMGRRDISATNSSDQRLYGLDNNQAAQMGRGVAVIANPTISADNADIFAGGRISSYFESSGAGSAFLFSNGVIENFETSGNDFPFYFLNDDRIRVKTAPDYTTGGSDAIASILGDELTTLENEASDIGGSITNTTFNLGQSSDRVYRVNGDLNLNNVTFSNGAGTFIVEGDLIISGDTRYAGGSYTTKTSVPSVGFLVYGDILVRPNVDRMVGTFFGNERFHSGSVLLNQSGNGLVPIGDRDASDSPLRVNGIVVVRSFVLARQLSGEENVADSSEIFNYDGRVVVNPPPGFKQLYTAPSAWNEGVTR